MLAAAFAFEVKTGPFKAPPWADIVAVWISVTIPCCCGQLPPEGVWSICCSCSSLSFFARGRKRVLTVRALATPMNANSTDRGRRSDSEHHTLGALMHQLKATMLSGSSISACGFILVVSYAILLLETRLFLWVCACVSLKLQACLIAYPRYFFKLIILFNLFTLTLLILSMKSLFFLFPAIQPSKKRHTTVPRLSLLLLFLQLLLATRVCLCVVLF